MKWLLFILSLTAVTAHAQESMSSADFCKQLNLHTSKENKQQFVEQNHQRVFQDYSDRFAAILGPVTNLASNQQITPQMLSRASYISIQKYYSGNFGNKVALLESLVNAPDFATCLQIINKEMTETHKMLDDLNRNNTDIVQHTHARQELRAKRNSKQNPQNMSCNDAISKPQCNGGTQTFSPDEGFNNLIQQVAPKAIEGGYNKFCDCSGSSQVGAADWRFKANYDLKNNSKELIQKELFRKKFFEMIDQHEKKLFLSSRKSQSLPAKLGCNNESLEDSLNRVCSGSGNKLNKKILSDVLLDFTTKSPRSQQVGNTIAEMENQIAKTQLKSNACAGMQYDTYAHIVNKEMGTNSAKFHHVYSLLFEELNQIPVNKYDSQLYHSMVKTVLKSPEKLSRLRKGLELKNEASIEEIMVAFEKFHLETTNNLGFKAILSSAKEMQELVKNKAPSFVRMLEHVSKPEVQAVQCENLLKEMTPYVCGDSSELDLNKYDINIDDMIDYYGYDLSVQEMQGLCLLRRENKNKQNLEKIFFTHLPLEHLPDVVSYYDPALASDERLKKSVMDIYAQNFCAKSKDFQLDRNKDQEQLEKIQNNPTYYLGYSGISDYTPEMETLPHSYLSTTPVDAGSDNGRERFVTASRGSIQSNQTTSPVILNTNKLEMKSYGSVGNVKTAVINRAPAAAIIKGENEEDKKQRIVDQYKDLDEDDADYFAKRKELLKQLYSSSEVPSTNLNEQDYLAKIKALEDQLSQKENQLNSINGITPKKSQKVDGSQSSAVGDNSSGFAVMNKQNEIVSNGNAEQSNSDRSVISSGGGKASFTGEENHEASHAQGNLNRSRGEGLYLSVTPADFSNPEFIKSMETQIKSLVNSDLDKLVQQLENGPLLIDVNGKKVGVNVEDLKKILDVETLKKIESKLELAKKKKSITAPQKMQKIVEKAKVENEIKEIKSEMYKTLLQLSSKLKSQGKI
jgi:hypothetical protein